MGIQTALPSCFMAAVFRRLVKPSSEQVRGMGPGLVRSCFLNLQTLAEEAPSEPSRRMAELDVSLSGADW